MANTTAREQEENYLDRIKVLERELEEANERLKRVGCTLDRERHEDSSPWDGRGHRLNKEQVERYSRQIILPSFGVQGALFVTFDTQIKRWVQPVCESEYNGLRVFSLQIMMMRAGQSRVCHGSVLVIGAGGLGSPALLYLAASGVGKIGIVDRDCVELSNIHRQVIHKEASVSQPKTESAAAALKALNSSIEIEEFREGFHPWNALEIVDRFDVVLDASDNAPTRYLISDACCVARKPLVSGAAIGTDGQLTVYCYGDDGPCYRCLFPKPPPPQNCARCADAGVLGPVPGIIGTMQALEVIKILAGIGEIFSRKLLMMDALYCRYHVVKLRARNQQCVACGSCPDVTRETLPGIDYMEFTGQQSASDGPPKPLNLVADSHRISAGDLIERFVGHVYEVIILFTTK